MVPPGKIEERTQVQQLYITVFAFEMGAYLEKPSTEKNMELKSGNNLRIGVCEMQGWRSSMEVRNHHSEVL